MHIGGLTRNDWKQQETDDKVWLELCILFKGIAEILLEIAVFDQY